MDEKPVKKRARSTLNDVLMMVMIHEKRTADPLAEPVMVTDENLIFHLSKILDRSLELELLNRSIKKLVE